MTLAETHICHRAVKQGYATLDFKYKCGLPDTGFDLWPILFLGFVLLMVGVAVVYFTRRGRMGK